MGKYNVVLWEVHGYVLDLHIVKKFHARGANGDFIPCLYVLEHI
jgi:hypothetical protein